MFVSIYLHSIICSKSKEKNSIMCPFTASFRGAEEMTFMTHCYEENLSLRLGLYVCQWYYCISVIHTPQERANHWGLCCRPKCEEFLSCCQERAELSNDNVRLETYRIKKRQDLCVSVLFLYKCNW